MSEETSGALSGAAQGAQYGSVLGPFGMVVGAVVGAAFGFASGSKKRAARLAANRAQKIGREVSYADAAVARRDLVRQGRIARAASVAAIAASGEGGLSSSAPRGALSSIGAQSTFNLGYFDWRIGKKQTQQMLIDKAGKYASQAQQIEGLWKTTMSVANFAMPTNVTPSQTTTSWNPAMETEMDKG